MNQRKGKTRRKPGEKRTERPPPPLTEVWLRKQAQVHLNRYWPSVAQLRRVLMRRVDRCLRFHGGERDAGAALVEGVLANLVERGALDDARFTKAWVEDLNRRGVSRRAIRHRMRSKGVSGQLVDQYLAQLTEELANPELAAACQYVRRRRFGPMRTDAEARTGRRQKDLAAMARAGFTFDVCKRALDCDDVDALRLMCEEAGGEWR